jgi:hypothetical protein
MSRFFHLLAKYFDQRKGLSPIQELQIPIKLIEYAIKKLIFKDFNVIDIWGVKQKFISSQAMGLNRMIGLYEIQEHIWIRKLLTQRTSGDVIDVGSSVGIFSCFIAKHSPQLTPFDFPLPRILNLVFLPKDQKEKFLNLI